MKHPSKIRLWEPLVLFAVIAVAIYYLVNVLNTQDWLWFRSAATEIQPSRIVIRSDGEVVTLSPGHKDFASLADAAEQSLKEVSNTDLISLGISSETVAFYEHDGVLLELYFDGPVKFHTAYRAGDPTQLLIPIEGRHSGKGYFFRGKDGEWWFGAMRMADPDLLLDKMAELGYPVDRGSATTY
jgi:hypothetical protein